MTEHFISGVLVCLGNSMYHFYQTIMYVSDVL